MGCDCVVEGLIGRSGCVAVRAEERPHPCTPRPPHPPSLVQCFLHTPPHPSTRRPHPDRGHQRQHRRLARVRGRCPRLQAHPGGDTIKQISFFIPCFISSRGLVCKRLAGGRPGAHMPLPLSPPSRSKLYTLKPNPKTRMPGPAPPGGGGGDRQPQHSKTSPGSSDLRPPTTTFAHRTPNSRPGGKLPGPATAPQAGPSIARAVSCAPRRHPLNPKFPSSTRRCRRLRWRWSAGGGLLGRETSPGSSDLRPPTTASHHLSTPLTNSPHS